MSYGLYGLGVAIFLDPQNVCTLIMACFAPRREDLPQGARVQHGCGPLGARLL